MNDILHAEFNATVDEIIEVQIKTYDKSPSIKRTRIITALSSIIVGEITVYLVAFKNSDLPIYLLILAYILIAIAIALLMKPLREMQYRYQLKKLIEEQTDHKNLVKCIFEIAVDGLVIIQNDVETKYPWNHIEYAVEKDGDIELGILKGLGIIRKRAFTSKEHKDAFIQEMQKNIDKNKG